VRPILSETCFLCHGPDHTTREAGLRLDSFEEATRDLGGYAALVPGDLNASELYYRLTAEDPDELMPPPGNHVTGSLTDGQIDTVRRWIEQGGEYEPHWAFTTPGTPEALPVGTNPVDLHLDRALAAAGIEPEGEAAPEALLRRPSRSSTPSWPSGRPATTTWSGASGSIASSTRSPGARATPSA